MKKVVSAVLCVTMLAGLLSGCGGKSSNASSSNSSSESASGKETIEFWTISLQPTYTDFFNGLIKTYEKENPGIKIKWVDLPYDSIQEKLVTAIAGGSSPDVVNLNTSMALTLAGKDSLVDLNKEATSEQKSVYIDSLWDSTQIGKSAYAFPWYASPDIMFYNTDLFQKAGITSVPTTYEQANKLAKQMKDATGAYLYTPPEYFNMLFENGVPILSDDKKSIAFDTDEAANLLTTFKSFTKDDILPASNWGKWDNELKLFETGKLAIISSSGSSLSRIKDEAPDIYNKIAVAKPLTGSLGLSRNALMNLVVPQKSKHQKDAIKFAAWITNDENQLAFCKQVAIFPSTKQASSDSYFTQDTTTLEGQARAMSVNVSTTSSDYSLGVEGQNEIEADVNKAYEAAIVGNTDPQKALDNAKSLAEKDLK